MANLKSLSLNDENIFDLIYPIGSIYETKDSEVNPQDLWGGSWVLVSSEPDFFSVGSQVLHPGMSGTGLVSSTTIACAYDRSLFEDLYGDKTKEGYHVELQLSAMGTCQNKNPITISLNNISFNLLTWSDATFRALKRSERFRPSDIIYETTSGYSQQGCNLKYEVTGLAGYTWQFWDVTIHGFLVEDSPIYKWQRTA